MILADTSIWAEHLRKGERRLARALEAGAVWMHPFVIGELACGNLHNRDDVLALLGQLPTATVATGAEVLAFIELHALMGRGIGWVDAHLLAAVALTPPVRLWTHDRRLGQVAVEMGIAAAAT